ncbi:MAG: response regulator [bacterium]|nr:response regulator [bacterium]
MNTDIAANQNNKPPLLLIDDEPSVRESFKLWLEDEGYPLYTAGSKSEAIKILKEQSVAVCLIDLKMKDESGLQISRELKKIDSLLKIIIVTGYPSYETAIDAMKMGIFDYVSKSSESKEILGKIENALNTRAQELSAIGGSSEDKHNLILVCHHVMIREGFEHFCREHPEYRLVHTYHSAEYIKSSDFNNNAALALFCSTCNQHCIEQPKVVFPQINHLFPHARLLMINCNFNDEKKKELVRLGIKGFLPKNIITEHMNRAFQSVLEGQIWISRKIAYSLLNELLEKNSSPEYLKPRIAYGLSNREIEILQVIASGLSNFAISTKLFISEKTVKAHINHIFKKMKVKSRMQAVKKAVDEHIL